MIGWAIVSIPSEITPRFCTSDVIAHMIQYVMLFKRRAMVSAAATIPSVVKPPIHSQMASEPMDTIIPAFRMVSIRSIFVTIRISDMKVWRACSIASRA